MSERQIHLHAKLVDQLETLTAGLRRAEAVRPLTDGEVAAVERLNMRLLRLRFLLDQVEAGKSS
jgi:hypothetical protein